MAKQIIFCLTIDYQVLVLNFCLILVLVEEKILFGGIVGPYVFYGFVYFAFVFELLKVLYDLHGSAGAHGVVYKLVLGGGPGSVFEFRCQFQCPVHDIQF